MRFGSGPKSPMFQRTKTTVRIGLVCDAIYRFGSESGKGACLKFGANAAWFRLNVLTDNLLSALKQIALPGEFSDARPKRLRFLVLNTVGKVAHHARQILLRLTSEAHKTILDLARSQIAALTPA